MGTRALNHATAGGKVVDRVAAASAIPLVRRRLLEASAASAAVAAIALAITGAVGGTVGLGVAFLTLAVGSAAVAIVSVRRVLEPIERLRTALEDTLELYDRARLDARVDPLTGLGNHRAFQEELVRLAAECAREGGSLALAILDLDDLKQVNDVRGHAAGDELLGSLGRLVGATIRVADRPFRTGGDEFAILMPWTGSEDAYHVVRRLLASATTGHPILRDIPRFSFSAGIATYPDPGGDTARLVRQADAALYWAKRHGRTDVQVFDPGRHGAAGDQRTTEELAAAVSSVAARRALHPVYQPIYSLQTGEVIGFEGLVRPAPDSGFTGAESLFAAAEVADRIVELDMAAVETVVAGVERLAPGRYLSVNLSPRTIETDQFRVGELVGILRRYGLEPSQVVLELTEREAIEDWERLKANLRRAREAGIRLAADDVGAGNAGLRLLSEVTFDILKIDLSLVQKGVLQDTSLSVLRALRDMADRWRAVVVAEGVETPEQVVALRRLGVSAAQGYLLGRPRDHAEAQPVDMEVIETMSNLEALAVGS